MVSSKERKNFVMIPLPIPEIISIGGSENRRFVVLRAVNQEAYAKDLKHLQDGITWVRKPNDPNAYIVEEIRDAVWEDLSNE